MGQKIYIKSPLCEAQWIRFLVLPFGTLLLALLNTKYINSIVRHRILVTCAILDVVLEKYELNYSYLYTIAVHVLVSLVHLVIVILESD